MKEGRKEGPLREAFSFRKDASRLPATAIPAWKEDRKEDRNEGRKEVFVTRSFLYNGGGKEGFLQRMVTWGRVLITDGIWKSITDMEHSIIVITDGIFCL